MAKVGSLRSKTSFVRVAFVADPATVARIVQAGGGDLLASNEITRFTLQPRHSASVRAWLDELLKVPGQHLDTYMERLGQTTGRWPALLYEIEEFFDGTAAASWGPEFDRFADTWVPTSDALPKRHRLFGFESAPNVSVLQVLAEVTTASVADLAALTELSSQEVLAALQWADLLGIAHPAGNDAWTLDSIAERLLKSLEPDESILVESSGA